MMSKEIIETIINTTAVSITGFGAVMLQQRDYFGFGLILFAMCLEFAKYKGRKEKLWR